eukprot:TRINITY_DN38476_c0_g1_i3.p1 TRINITY_DN38476_c0_g1~~TRINITY_DN38476_c0_g1_i3.p1  ORF type:complete len:310 (-),score=66.86 TRINITY_DN38476_c0_g1_i3:11-940(-)
MCTTKLAFVQLLSLELGAAFAARKMIHAAAEILSMARRTFHTMITLPYYKDFRWKQPMDVAFNHELYPNYFGPVWPNDQVPLATFLEEHFEEFRADLDGILNAGATFFDHLRDLERNAEGLSVWPPGRRKHIELADMREEEQWKAQICHYAPRTCELIRQRREITDCPRAAVMMAKLDKAAWLKPHYGNSRRLVAHLGLIIPPGPISLNVGPARDIRWQQGKAMIFDDTYAHDARHLAGDGERYILHMMLCHPCEQRHLYPTLPEEACEFQDPVRAEVSRAMRFEMDANEENAKKAVRMVIPRNAPEDV